MAIEAELPVVRQIEIQRPIVENVLEMQVLHEVPSEDQARAIEHVFAQKQKEPDMAASLLLLASSGMMVHDIVQDTLASPDDEDDEEEEEAKRRKPQ